MAMVTDGTSGAAALPRIVVPLVHVTFAEEAAAFRALMLWPLAAVCGSATVLSVSLFDDFLVREVQRKVVTLALAGLPVADLLAVVQPVAMLVAESATAVLTHSDRRVAARPEES